MVSKPPSGFVIKEGNEGMHFVLLGLNTSSHILKSGPGKGF
jgi:hypothetical protein